MDEKAKGRICEKEKKSSKRQSEYLALDPHTLHPAEGIEMEWEKPRQGGINPEDVSEEGEV
jgi:hypothetical protein